MLNGGDWYGVVVPGISYRIECIGVELMVFCISPWTNIVCVFDGGEVCRMLSRVELIRCRSVVVC